MSRATAIIAAGAVALVFLGIALLGRTPDRRDPGVVAAVPDVRAPRPDSAVAVTRRGEPDDPPADLPAAGDTAGVRPAREDAPDRGAGADREGAAGSRQAGRPTTAPDSPQAAAGPAAQDPDSILRATAAAYEAVRSVRAAFVQELDNALLGRTTRSAGTVYQRQPDRFLMDFSDPEGDLIVSDGSWFWMWFPSVDSTQVLRTARGGSGLDLRAQFIGDPVSRFEAAYHGVEPVGGRPAHAMTLVPRNPAGYTRLDVWIDAADHLVRRFALHETSGNVRRFELGELRVNVSLPDDLFEFAPPPGVRVVTR